MRLENIKNFAETRFGLAVITVIVCMIIYAIFSYAYIYNAHSDDYNDFIFGYWVADDAFCQESDIDSMLLFIGKPTKGQSRSNEVSRPAHMVIGDDIMNQKINIKHSRINSGFSRKIQKFSTKCSIDFEDECQIPSNVIMDFDIKAGSLRIHDGDKLYALMYKDHEISEQFSANKAPDLNEEKIAAKD